MYHMQKLEQQAAAGAGGQLLWMMMIYNDYTVLFNTKSPSWE